MKIENQAKITAYELEIRDLTKEQEGWLITVPNPMYDGTTAGIKFNSGMAFLPADATYPHLGGKRGKKEYIPDSERVANFLQDHFGYEIKFYTYDEMRELKSTLDERNADRDEAAKLVAQEALQEKTLRSLSRSMNISR